MPEVDKEEFIKQLTLNIPEINNEQSPTALVPAIPSPRHASPLTYKKQEEYNNVEYAPSAVCSIGKTHRPSSIIPSGLQHRLSDESSPFMNIPDIFFKNVQPETSITLSQNDFRDIQTLLIKYRKEALLLSEIHMLSSRYCTHYNQICTLTSLILSIMCSVANPIIVEYTSKQMHELFSSITFAFIGGLNVVFNFIAFQQRAERHKQIQEHYVQIIDTIEVALAISNEEGVDTSFDFNKILSDVRVIKNTIAKNSITIPSKIANRYDFIISKSLRKIDTR